MNLALITTLQGYAANVQLAHWQADTLTSAHEALGELYGSLIENVDRLAEVEIGKQGGDARNSFQTAEVRIESVSGDYSKLIGTGLDIISDIRGELVDGDDDDLLNIVADMSITLNKAKYLLKV